MTLRRSECKAKPKTIWEEKGAPAALNPKITKKNAPTELKTALKSIPIGHLLDAVKLDLKSLSKLPTYNLLLKLQFRLSELLATNLLELKMF
jgi:hypothetical protein